MKKLFALTALLAASLALPCEAATFGPNLIINGNGENGNGSPLCVKVPIPGWNSTGNFTVGTYNGRADVLQSTSKGPPTFGPKSRGRNFFCGGNSASSSAEQTIDLSSSAKDIDTGKTQFDLSGWLGGDGSSDDSATLVATFKDIHSTPLKVVKVGPVKASDRFNITSLVFKNAKGTIPVGTRSATINLHMQRVNGLLCDGYADNLSFKIAKPTVATNVKTAGTTGTTGTTTTTGTTGTTAVTRNTNTKPNFWSFATALLTTAAGGNPNNTTSTIGGGATNPSVNLTGGSTNPSINTSSGGGSVFAPGSGSTTGNPTLGTPSTGLVQVSSGTNATTITIPSSMLFGKFSSTLLPSAGNLLTQIKLQKMASHGGKPIAFAAHTNESQNSRINLGLASKRAFAVAAWMDNHGVPASNFEVRAFAKPLATSSSANSNRLEIVLMNSRNASTLVNPVNISGLWKSTFGPLTLVEHAGNVTGHWVTPLGQKGQVNKGSFDSSTGRLTLHYTKNWEGSHGHVTFNKINSNTYRGKFLQLDKSGTSQTGTWQIMR